ncbi:OBAP family protein [Enterobacter sp. Bisph1]|uniref:OBAP family protein n=1 Tax=Enterobacter sp. Bisph1 TaxID=1274399 RepID=UPI00057BDFD9|nr:OBAP family protein [Enterobacter sp. Bisph1]
MRLALTLLIPLALVGCGANNSGPQSAIPGDKTSAKMKTLETGAALMQSRPPIEAISTYLDGFHFYNGNKKGQMEAHHYVTVLNNDVMQAVIYDGNTADARLMGVEYIISERLFNTLPAEEKKLWHSHRYEVKSGSLIAPGLPAAAEKSLMSNIVNTYGKTWHTWHTEQNQTLPLGVPALMMGFTGDGQLKPSLLVDRDRRFGVNTEEIKKERADLPAHPVAKGADAWEQGQVIQIRPVKLSSQGDQHFH